MAGLSTFNIEKLIHSFIENLTSRVSPIWNKEQDGINFISYVNVAYHINLELLRIGAEVQGISMKNTLDIADVESVHHFIERQTKFPDKFIYPKSIPLLTCHFDHINKKIVQKIRDINKINKNLKKQKAKYFKNKSSKLEQVTIENNGQVYNISILERKLTLEDLLSVKTKNACLKEHNLPKNIVEYTRQEAILNEKYLQLYINNVGFVKNVHITLYVTNKTLYDAKHHPGIIHNERKSDYHHMLMLCKHAILCLIDPSEKAFVYMEDNLPVIIRNHLLQGYVYHFDFASDTKDYYSAVLILSKWIKPLVSHPNTTMLRAISIILKCNICDILVLSHHLV